MRSVHLAFVVSAMLCAVLSAQANFDCYALGRFPLPGPPNCENLLCNGLGLSGQTGISANISCGFPTSGAQYGRLDGNGPFAVPNGGPVAYPLPNNVTELRIPIPAGSTNVAFCWDFYNAEGFGSSFNDGMAISVVNPTGGLVQALVYADVNNLPGPCTDFFGFGGTEIGQAGPQGFTSTLSPFPVGSYLSVCAWNGGDNAVPSHMCIDDVHFNGTAPSCPLPPPPPVNDDCSNATAVVNGSNGPFSNNAATNSAVFATCGFGADLADVWFVFVAPCTGPYNLDTCGASFNTVLSVHDNCPNGNELGCNDDDFSGACPNFTDSRVTVNLTAATPYWIRVAGNAFFGGASGTFNLNINQTMQFNFTTAGPGSVGFQVSGGPPGGLYFAAITLNAGNFPNGNFFGIDIGLQELANEFVFGFPFAGPLAGCGSASFGPVGGLPSGLSLYGTALGFPGPGYGIPSVAAVAPASVTIP